MKKLAYFVLFGLLVMVLICAGGCGNGNGSGIGGGGGNDSVIDISGSWTFLSTFTHDACYPDNVNTTIHRNITIHRSESEFWFDFAVSDPPITAVAEGTISPDGGVLFGFGSESSVWIQWTGTATTTSMSGTFVGHHEDGPSCTFGGNWTATKK